MKRKRPIPAFSIAVFSLCLICAVLLLIMDRSPAFSDTMNSTVSAVYRTVAAKVFDIIPFSFGELLLFSSPVLVFLSAYLLCRYSSCGRIYILRAVSLVLCLPAIVFSMFVIGFAPGYRGSSLDEKLDLERSEVSAEKLYASALCAAEETAELLGEVDFRLDGASVMPFTYDRMSEKLSSAYEKAGSKYSSWDSLSSRVKPLVISKYMTYTHLSGIYFFFTGEANINTNYPDFIVVYTAAHEMAHQRGISREDEANFTAFLVCRESEDPYIRYCGSLNMLEYLMDALYSAHPSMYSDLYSQLPAPIKGELYAYARFFDEYRDNSAADISDSLNEAYLVSQGTQGVKSYGLVADLAVAFYKEKIIG